MPTCSIPSTHTVLGGMLCYTISGVQFDNSYLGTARWWPWAERLSRNVPCETSQSQARESLSVILPAFPTSLCSFWQRTEACGEVVHLSGGAKLLLNGAEPLVVNGVPDGYRMPQFRVQLNDEQIAQVPSFVRASWENDAGAVLTDEVKKLRPATDPSSDQVIVWKCADGIWQQRCRTMSAIGPNAKCRDVHFKSAIRGMSGLTADIANPTLMTHLCRLGSILLRCTSSNFTFTIWEYPTTVRLQLRGVELPATFQRYSAAVRKAASKAASR